MHSIRIRKSNLIRHTATSAKWLAIAFAAISPILTSGGSASAQEPAPIVVVSAHAISEFPNGIRFIVTAHGDNEISSIAVRFRIGLQPRGVYEYLDFKPGGNTHAEVFWRTNTAQSYIPPETIITYHYEISDSAGNVVTTDPGELIYEDVRLTWNRVSEGPVTVAYHGPVKTRAQSVLRVILETLETMGPVLGAGIDDPIRVVMYNNQKEMLEALPPRSATVGRELVTQGQAFNTVGTLIILAGGQLALGTASHEVTHILNHRAGHSIFHRLPSWLHEGLAEFGNVDPGYSYDVALEFAVATDRLLPHLFMQTLPGDPEDVIIFYGQSKSTVRFMIELQGAEGMRRLLALHKEGANMDDALLEVYGMNRLELTNAWRSAIDAPPYEPPEIAEARPTPVAYPTVQAFTLTPQAGGRSVGDLSAGDVELNKDDVVLMESSQAATDDLSQSDDGKNKVTTSAPNNGSCNTFNGNGDGGTLTMLMLLVACAGARVIGRTID